MDVPTGDVPMRNLLPALRATADAFVSFAAERSAAAGKPVSCRAGCGACCRQLVPVAPAEARRIESVVEDLPEPRRSEVKERFADALGRIEAGGLLPALEGRDVWEAGRTLETGIAYMRLGVACPFLEDESCSIYEERPLACREYLVTSAPALCAAPTRESVDTVPLPARVWPAVAREEAGAAATTPAPWVPLVLALEWAAKNRVAEVQRPGPEVLRGVFSRFSRDRSGGGERA